MVLLGAGGYVAYAQVGKPDTDSAYRLATAGKGSVSQTLTLTGTVKRVSQVTVAFPVSGTVTSVLVKIGDTVTPGQRLATIDQTPLLAAVTDAQATLLQAQAQATSDEAETTGSTRLTEVIHGLVGFVDGVPGVRVVRADLRLVVLVRIDDVDRHGIERLERHHQRDARGDGWFGHRMPTRTGHEGARRHEGRREERRPRLRPRHGRRSVDQGVGTSSHDVAHDLSDHDVAHDVHGLADHDVPHHLTRRRPRRPASPTTAPHHPAYLVADVVHGRANHDRRRDAGADRRVRPGPAGLVHRAVRGPEAVSGYAPALTAVQQQARPAAGAGAATANGSSGSSGSNQTGSSGSSGGSPAPRVLLVMGLGSGGGGSGSLSTEAARGQEAKILGDQASITEAEHALSEAQANLAASTLTAPSAGS